MNKEELDRLIWDYLDGKLSEKEILKLKDRMREDPSVQKTYDKAMMIQRLMNGWLISKAPSGLIDRTLQKVDLDMSKKLNGKPFQLFILVMFVLGISSIIYPASIGTISLITITEQWQIPLNINWDWLRTDSSVWISCAIIGFLILALLDYMANKIHLVRI